jgi:ElaB/YqjD/DUF883 family membrane-anchored ribosome-binding protein
MERHMKRHTNASHTQDPGSLAEDAKTLIAATADVAEEKVVEARERLAAALDRGKATWVRLQDSASERVKATDHSIRTHPYQVIGVAFGVGALLGVILSRRV